jgi:hypothetical protein
VETESTIRYCIVCKDETPHQPVVSHGVEACVRCKTLKFPNLEVTRQTQVVSTPVDKGITAQRTL